VTEGLWDPYPQAEVAGAAQEDGEAAAASSKYIRQRGWADRLATALSARRISCGEPALEYANLAVRGRKLPQIVAEQVPAALTSAPDLVSILGGGNDILRPGVDVEDIAGLLEEAVVQVRATGADVLLGTGFKSGRALRWTRSATGQFNAEVWGIAQRHGCHVLDLWGMTSLFDLRLWADDRIHPTPDGHERIKDAALVALGLAPDNPAYDVPLGPDEDARWDRIKGDASWARSHGLPWIGRRMAGKSSGDRIRPKWATPVVWEPGLGEPDTPPV
jgi:lysophospholipase L1-like esterase